MRVFISADIEGTTFTTLWDETELGHNLYAAAAKQMTVVKACRCHVEFDIFVGANLYLAPFSVAIAAANIVICRHVAER